MIGPLAAWLPVSVTVTTAAPLRPPTTESGSVVVTAGDKSAPLPTIAASTVSVPFVATAISRPFSAWAIAFCWREHASACAAADCWARGDADARTLEDEHCSCRA